MTMIGLDSMLVIHDNDLKLGWSKTIKIGNTSHGIQHSHTTMIVHVILDQDYERK